MENEMAMDLDRLWHRNYGRDDRAISANGREGRFPFLDTQLMLYMRDNVSSQNELVDFSEYRGQGDKKMIRLIAREEFGMKFAS